MQQTQTVIYTYMWTRIYRYIPYKKYVDTDIIYTDIQSQTFIYHIGRHSHLYTQNYRHAFIQTFTLTEDIEKWGHTTKFVETIDIEKVIELVKETNIKIYVL